MGYRLLEKPCRYRRRPGLKRNTAPPELTGNRLARKEDPVEGPIEDMDLPLAHPTIARMETREMMMIGEDRGNPEDPLQAKVGLMMILIEKKIRQKTKKRGDVLIVRVKENLPEEEESKADQGKESPTKTRKLLWKNESRIRKTTVSVKVKLAKRKNRWTRNTRRHRPKKSTNQSELQKEGMIDHLQEGDHLRGEGLLPLQQIHRQEVKAMNLPRVLQPAQEVVREKEETTEVMDGPQEGTDVEVIPQEEETVIEDEIGNTSLMELSLQNTCMKQFQMWTSQQALNKIKEK